MLVGADSEVSIIFKFIVKNTNQHFKRFLRKKWPNLDFRKFAATQGATNLTISDVK